MKDDASRRGLCWVAVARVMRIVAGDSEAKVEDRIESWGWLPPPGKGGDCC